MESESESEGERWPWHTIHGRLLVESLRRAHNGEDPEMIYMELCANAELDGGSDG